MGTQTWMFEQEDEVAIESLVIEQGRTRNENLGETKQQQDHHHQQQVEEILVNCASWESLDSEDYEKKDSRVGSIVVIERRDENTGAFHAAGDLDYQQTAKDTGEWVETVLGSNSTSRSHDDGPGSLDSSERISIQSEWIVNEIKKSYCLIDCE